MKGRKTQCRKSKAVRNSFILCIGIVALAGAVLGGFALHFSIENSRIVCLSCDEDGVMSPEWKPNANGYCCVKLEDLMLDLKTITERKAVSEASKYYRNSKAQPGRSLRRTSIHLTLPARVTNEPDNGEAVKGWDIDSQQAGISYLPDTGEILVQSSGLYFITSQLSFLEYSSSIGDVPSIHHKIVSSGPNTPPENILLQRIESMWKPAKHRTYSQMVSYLADIVHLEKYTKVSVKTNVPQFINVWEPRMNYFSIFKL